MRLFQLGFSAQPTFVWRYIVIKNSLKYYFKCDELRTGLWLTSLKFIWNFMYTPSIPIS